ncbi:adenylate cyclase, partial [Chamaesiphon polymorphus CCALA 037]
VVQISPPAIEVFVKVPPVLKTSIEQQISVSLIDLFDRSHCQIPDISYQEYVDRTEHHLKMRRIQRTFTPDN